MDEFQLTDFPKLYSTNKKEVERFAEQVYHYAKYYSYITVRDFVRLWFNLKENQSNSYVQSASVQWCVEYKDLPKRHDIKKDNTKAIIRAVSGVTNKEYKQYLFEITRPSYCTTQSHEQTEQHKAKHLFGDLNDITPYKFDETILYRLFGYIHRYKKTIEVWDNHIIRRDITQSQSIWYILSNICLRKEN